MEVIAFIPARSGSTRLKNKNVLLVKKRPLFFWSVKTAIESKLFNKILFSSDSKKYFSKLIYFLRKDKIPINKLIFDHRNSEEAGNKKKIFDYIKKDLLKKYKFKKNDLLVQMLPTAPLRTKKTIKDAIFLAIHKKKNIFTACEYDFHLSFALSLNSKNKWTRVFKNSPLVTGNTQSQSQKKYFRPNPLANCLWIKNIKTKNRSIYENALVLCTKKTEALDIDDYEDFSLVKLLLEEKK